VPAVVVFDREGGLTRLTDKRSGKSATPQPVRITGATRSSTRSPPTHGCARRRRRIARGVGADLARRRSGAVVLALDAADRGALIDA